MRTFLLLCVSMIAWAQTEVTTPLQVLAPNDDSAPSVVQVQDQAQHFIGFIAPALVTQIVVTSATAANPMVLTLANPRPTTITTTSGVTISGATGAGCSGMNATHAVSAVGTSTITITFNGTGCTYGASSASIKTSIYWQLPAADCVTGEVWGWTAPYVLGCVTGSAGANIQLSNLGTTAINAALLFGAANTIDIGSASGASRTGARTIYAQTEVEAPDFRVTYFSAGVVQDYFDITATTSTLYFKDSGGTTVGLYSNPVFPVWQFRGEVVPDSSAAYDLGSTTALWDKIWGVSARLTGLGGTGTRCIETDNDGDLAVAAGACGTAGANIQLSNLGTTAINAHLLLDTANTYDIGAASGSSRTGLRTLYAQTEVEAPDFRVTYFSAGVVQDYFDITATTSTLYFKDSSGTTVGLYSNAVTPIWQFRGKVVPDATTTYDLGSTTSLWNNFFTVNARITGLGGGGTQCLNTDNDGDLSAVACPSGTGTVTSVGQSFTGGLISVAGSPITTSGTLALTVAGTSGGVPYFSSASTWASSGALTANLPVIGGGAGAAPTVGTRSGNTTAFVTTTGTQTSGDCVKIDASGNHIAANGLSLGCAGTGLSNLTATAINVSLIANTNATYDLGSAAIKWQNVYANNVIGVTVQATGLSGASNRCAYLTTTGLLAAYATDLCVETSRTISTTSPLGGGGDLSANRTLTCTTCVTNVTGTSPIVSSGGTTPALSCSTCVTTAGGQTISGTTTVSTLSVSTAISGTFNVSGNGTVTGNWYERTFSGGNASCGGVSDGWLGVRTDTGGTSGKPEIQVCIGGAMKYSALN